MLNGFFNIGKGIYNWNDILTGKNESMRAESQSSAENLVSGFNASAPSNAFDLSGIEKAIMNGYDGLRDVFTQLSTNAMAAEKASVDAANLFSKEMQKDQQRFNAEQADLAWSRSQASAQQQMQFQERMANEAMAYQTNLANSAFQRAVKDMQAAGLNPILAYTKGGASAPAGIAPSGASASASAASSSAASGAKANASSAYTANVNATRYKLVASVVNTAFDLIENVFK